MASPVADDERGLTANRSFVLLFSAQVVSLLGSGATTVALALLAYDMVGSRSATAVLGNALMLRILAFLIFSQPAGVLADRVSRKRILVLADVARAALLCVMPWVTETWHVYLLVFAINAVTAFFTPAYESSLPAVVGETHLVKALALSRVATDVEAIAAPAAAALIVWGLGARWVFPFDAATYLLSAALVLGAVVPFVEGKREQSASFFDEVTHGVRVIAREPSLRSAVTFSVAEALAGACAIVATVAYVRDVLGESETMVAWAMGAVGLGSSLGALALGRWSRAREVARGSVTLHEARHRWSQRALSIGGVVLCASLLPGLLLPPLAVLLGLWLSNGAGQALIAIPSSVLLAEHTAPEERGRVYAAHFALTHAGWLVAYPAVGHAAAAWGPAATFTSTGIVAAVVTLVAASVSRAPAR